VAPPPVLASLSRVSQLMPSVGQTLPHTDDMTPIADPDVRARVAEHYSRHGMASRRRQMVLLVTCVMFATVVVEWLSKGTLRSEFLLVTAAVWALLSIMGWTIINWRGTQPLDTHVERALAQSRACQRCGAVVLSFEQTCLRCGTRFPWGYPTDIDRWMPLVFIGSAIILGVIVGLLAQ